MTSNVHTFHPIADERVWAFRYKTVVTAFAVVSVRYVVLIDTLVNAATAQAMVDALHEPLQTRQLLVMNTHADWDHCYGNMVFAGPHATHSAPIIGHRLCRERLRGDGARAKLLEKQASDPETFGGVQLIPPTLAFDGVFTIDGGDLSFDLIHTPGHTADHVSVFVPELRMLFPGDAAETPLPFVPDAGGLPQLRASLQRLQALHAATVLYCHADSTGPDVIAQNIAYFDEVERRVRAAGARHAAPLRDDNIDLEDVISFPLDEVPGADHLDDDERTFYRRAHHDALRATVDWVQNMSD